MLLINVTELVSSRHDVLGRNLTNLRAVQDRLPRDMQIGDSPLIILVQEVRSLHQYGYGPGIHDLRNELPYVLWIQIVRDSVPDI